MATCASAFLVFSAVEVVVEDAVPYAARSSLKMTTDSNRPRQPPHLRPLHRLNIILDVDGHFLSDQSEGGLRGCRTTSW